MRLATKKSKSERTTFSSKSTKGEDLSFSIVSAEAEAKLFPVSKAVQGKNRDERTALDWHFEEMNGKCDMERKRRDTKE